MRERQDSGLSVRAYCASAGIHENSYFYWQKKLREAACEELARIHGNTTGLAHPGFAEVVLPVQLPPVAAGALHGQVCIESVYVRITADGEYPADRLAVLLREVSRQ